MLKNNHLIAGFVLALVACCWVTPAQGQGQDRTFVRTYMIPLPEENVYEVCKLIHNGVKAPMRSRTQIVPSVTNTVIYYDHWEDGYELDIYAPTQETSAVWGDGILTNGVAPGTTNDYLLPGRTVTLINDIEIPRDPELILYDARDILVASLPVNLTRELNAKDPGEALSGAVNVYPTEMYGFKFYAPVGVNTDVGSKMFQVSSMVIMARDDTTLLEIDLNGDEVPDRLELLNRGESLTVDNFQAGGFVQASRPISAYLLTGSISASYQMRWFTMLPRESYGNEYFTAVGSSGGRTARVYIFNPNNNSASIKFETLLGTATINVPSGATMPYNVPANTGGRLYSTSGADFFVVEVFDYGAHAYDWGHTLFPRSLLTEQAIVGWGPGSSDNSKNGSPIWVAPVANTTIYIDYDGNPDTGPLTDPVGNRYDVSTNATRLGMHRIYDPTDNDQTSMRLYTLNNVDICTVWGLDADGTSAGNPYLDMGYALLPVPLTIPAKSVSLFDDVNGDTLISPGDILAFTVSVTRVGVPDTNAVIVADQLDVHLLYVPGSSSVNGTNIADIKNPNTDFPFDEGGFNIGVVDVGETATLSYLATVDPAISPSIDGVVNIASVAGQEYILFTPIQRGNTVAGSVRSDRRGEGQVYDIRNPGLPGVTVYLYTDPNGDGNPSDGVPVQTNVTGVVGNFFFNNVAPGYYVLVEQDPFNYFSTGDSDAPNDNWIGLYMIADVDNVGHIFLDALAGFNVEKTALPLGIWFPELEATFQIRVSNTGVVDQTNIQLVDVLPSNLTYVAGSALILMDTLVTNNVLDTFSSADYTVNEGSENWSSPWSETDCSGSGPSAGQVQIAGGELRISGNLSGCGGSPAAEIMRTVDLLGYYRARLTFDFRTTGTEDDDVVYLHASTNGVNWELVQTFQGATNGIASVDLEEIGSGPITVRFQTLTNTYTDNDDYFYVDNAEVELLEFVGVPMPGNDPPNLLSNVTLLPGSKVDVFFNAIVSGESAGVTNRACAYSAIVSNGICSTLVRSVDTTAVPDRVGAQLINDLNGNGIAETGERGIRDAIVEIYTDPNGDGDPADGVFVDSRITDYQGFVLFGGLSNGYYVLYQPDESGFASTGDSTPPNNSYVSVHLPGGVDSLTNYFLDWTISGLNVDKACDEIYDLVPNQDVTYSITVTNTRNAAQGNVRIVDTFLTDAQYIPGTATITFNRVVETNNIVDTFSGIAYTNSSGSLPWVGNWAELGDDTLASSGDILVQDDLGSRRLLVSDDSGSVTRQLPDLTEYHTAELSFLYRRSSLEDNEYLSVMVATNEAGPWNELAKLGHFGLGFTTDLAYRQTNYFFSSFISTSTFVRFSTPTGGMSNGDMIYVDDVVVKLTKGGINVQPCDPPPIMLDNYTIEPYESITITFDAGVGIEEYVINQAHVTSAGDPSGLYSVASNRISSAILTQGLVNAMGDAVLFWEAVTNEQGQVARAYDLIHADSSVGMDNNITSLWSHLQTVTNSMAEDNKHLTNAPGLFRFYRLSFPDRWNPGGGNKYASKELYVGRCVDIVEGENWISLFMAPDKNKLKDIFGNTILPAGPDMGSSTRIEWYAATDHAFPTNVVWLSDAGFWMYSQGGVADNMPLPLHQGFNLILPPGSGAMKLSLVGQLPTTNHTDVSFGKKVPFKANKAYNVVSYPLPTGTKLKDTGIKEAGFTGTKVGQPVNPLWSDELRVLQSGGGSFAAPKYRLLMNSSGQWVYWTGGSGIADNLRLESDDALIIYSRVSTNDYEWDVNIPYDTPNLQMNP